MLFYSIDARKCQKENETCSSEKFRDASAALLRECEGKAYVAVAKNMEFKVNLIAVIRHDAVNCYPPEGLVEKFNAHCSGELAIESIKEITAEDFVDLLSFASIDALIDNDEEIKNCFNIEINEHWWCYENVAKPMSKEEIEHDAQITLYDKSFNVELERIYEMKNPDGALVHPVHYIIRSESATDDEKIVQGLINALYENDRLKSKRYTTITLVPQAEIGDLYSSYDQQKGGTVIVRLDDFRADDAYGGEEQLRIMKSVARLAQKNREHTLTVVIIPINGEKYVELLSSRCSIPFVEITPENATGEVARRYLTYMAQEAGVEADEELFKDVREYRAMCRSELRDKFNEWYSDYMTTKKYPLYKNMKVRSVVEEKKDTVGKAAKELEAMIGLDEVKRVIKSAVDYYKVQRVYRAFGKRVNKPSMHMVFTGNPGSAKTTVARLFAQILKDCDAITSGSLVEVGRADLVGKYVGHTAPKVKEAFERARGGVLFIDEAYSLLDDRGNSYGDEAINTIVQEMENNRSETIVIFAGYPEEMEEFLDRNPGLKSRIAFNVHFDDYDADELWKIAQLFAEKGENVFTEGCEEKLFSIFTDAARERDFGNGRFVRNIMEHAEMARATRIAQMNMADIKERDLDTFLPEDFDMISEENGTREVRRIGFFN